MPHDLRGVYTGVLIHVDMDLGGCLLISGEGVAGLLSGLRAGQEGTRYEPATLPA